MQRRKADRKRPAQQAGAVEVGSTHGIECAAVSNGCWWTPSIEREIAAADRRVGRGHTGTAFVYWRVRSSIPQLCCSNTLTRPMPTVHLHKIAPTGRGKRRHQGGAGGLLATDARWMPLTPSPNPAVVATARTPPLSSPTPHPSSGFGARAARGRPKFPAGFVND